MGERRGRHRSLHIALFPWGGVVDDFLGPIGISRYAFATEMSGGWLFGFAEALRGQDLHMSVFCFSADVTRPERLVNPATGMACIFLPPSRLYRALRRWPGDADDPGRPKMPPRFSVIQELVRYAATPDSTAAAVLGEGCNAILVQEIENPRFDRLSRIGQRLGIPVFATFQGAPPAGNSVERRIRSRSTCAAAGFVVASAPEAERLAVAYGIEAARIARIPNPLDLSTWAPEARAACRAYLGLPAAATIFICHGRIDLHRKGLDVLLEAWRRLVERRPGPDLRLHLIGSGQDDAALAAMIEARPVPGLRWVRRYINDRAEMRRELSSADVYVMASRHEGFPVAPLEAMACGLPVIAADAQGIPDIFPGGERDGGVVVPRGDAEALAAAMDRAATDPALRARLAAQAQDRVAGSFSLAAVGKSLANFVCNCAEWPQNY